MGTQSRRWRRGTLASVHCPRPLDCAGSFPPQSRGRGQGCLARGQAADTERAEPARPARVESETEESYGGEGQRGPSMRRGVGVATIGLSRSRKHFRKMPHVGGAELQLALVLAGTPHTITRGHRPGSVWRATGGLWAWCGRRARLQEASRRAGPRLHPAHLWGPCPAAPPQGGAHGLVMSRLCSFSVCKRRKEGPGHRLHLQWTVLETGSQGTRPPAPPPSRRGAGRGREAGPLVGKSWGPPTPIHPPTPAAPPQL